MVTQVTIWQHIFLVTYMHANVPRLGELVSKTNWVGSIPTVCAQVKKIQCLVENIQKKLKKNYLQCGIN